MKLISCLLAAVLSVAAQSAFPPASGGGGGGGGASATYQITDMSVTLGGGALAIAAGCSPTSICNAGYGEITTGIQASASIGAPTGTGTAYIWAVPSTGAIGVGLPASGLTATCTGCTTITATSVPVGMIPLWKWTATSNAWNSGGGTDLRSFLKIDKPMTVTPCTGGTWTETNSSRALDLSGCSGGGSGPFLQQYSYPFTTRDDKFFTCNLASGIYSVYTVAYNITDGCALDLASAGGQYVVVDHTLASTWNGSAINVQLYWYNASGGTGNVEWDVSAFCANAANGITATYSTPVATTLAVPTYLSVKISTLSVGLTGSGCAASVPALLKIKIANKASGSGGTTYTSNIDVFAATVSIVQ